MSNQVNTKVLIGRVPVDSGQIMLVDPCYVLDGDVDFADDHKTVITDNPYSRACAASMSDEQAGIFATNDDNSKFDDAVCTSTGWGDGRYPVYVEYDSDGRVKTMTIDFSYDGIDHDDEYGWED